MYAIWTGKVQFATIGGEKAREYVKVTGTVADYFDGSAIASAQVYIKTEAGSVIPVTTDSSGQFKTETQLLEGSYVDILVKKSGYVTAYFTHIQIPEGNYAFREEASLGVFKILPESTVSLKFSDQNKNTISSSYNMTENGQELTLYIDIILDNDKSGFGGSWGKWESGTSTQTFTGEPWPNLAQSYITEDDIYDGGYLVITLDTDYVHVESPGSFSRVDGPGSTDYYYVDFGTILKHQDADMYGIVTYSIQLYCVQAGNDVISVSLYSNISQKDIGEGYLSEYTAAATSTIDIVE